jgi:hypothetical protein
MTLNEIIYRIKENLKVNSDDLSFDYPNELLANMVHTRRALLLKQRYSDARKKLPNDMYQLICIDLSLVDNLTEVCNGNIVKSDVALPDLLDIAGEYKIYLKKQENLFPLNLNYVQLDRLPYTGNNPLLKNQIYVAIDPGNYLYLRGDNQFYKLIDELQIWAVLENPDEAYDHLCPGQSSPCDPYEEKYPLPTDLIDQVIITITKELLATTNLDEDNINNADESNR